MPCAACLPGFCRERLIAWSRRFDIRGEWALAVAGFRIRDRAIGRMGAALRRFDSVFLVARLGTGMPHCVILERVTESMP